LPTLQNQEKQGNADKDSVLTVREVALYLRMAESTVYRLAQDGKLPGRKIGGMWRFSRQELDRWVTQPPGKEESPPE
jgi:excisionase family DNA binding protein